MRRQAMLFVNLAVLLFGLAGLFAKWIHLPAIEITFGRVLFSSIALGAYMRIRRQSFRVDSKKDWFLLIIAGIVLALHWWSFLASIQMSTVAVGTLTFASFPLFVTFLEPLVFRQKLHLIPVVIAVVILAGVMITIPELSFENSMVKGILTGMLSALSYAVLTLLNKGFMDRYSGTKTAFYEQLTAAIVLLPFVLKAGVKPTATDIGLLLALGVITTALAHTLFITSLKALPAQLAGVFSSVETVYGILFAFLLLGEAPSARELIGAGIILLAVLAGTLYSNRQKGL